jgi:hypothetical protein
MCSHAGEALLLEQQRTATGMMEVAVEAAAAAEGRGRGDAAVAPAVFQTCDDVVGRICGSPAAAAASVAATASAAHLLCAPAPPPPMHRTRYVNSITLNYCVCYSAIYYYSIHGFNYLVLVLLTSRVFEHWTLSNALNTYVLPNSFNIELHIYARVHIFP